MSVTREKNFVADQQNWEQRIRTELDSSKLWQSNWGVLYNPGAPSDYEGKIKSLEATLKTMSGERLRTTNMDYGVGAPFSELNQRQTRRGIKDLDEF